MATGLNGYLPKSLTDEEMTLAIQTILDGQIFVPSLVTMTGPASHRGPSTDSTAGQPDIGGPRMPATRVTPRQREVLECVRQGFTNKEIARRLDITEGTAKIHVAMLLTAYGARNRTELALRQ